jgi:hypothetical protein
MEVCVEVGALLESVTKLNVARSLIADSLGL